MTTLAAELAPRGLAEVQDPAFLSRLHDPASAAVLWRRPMPEGVARWIDTLDPTRLPNGRVIVGRDGVASAVAAFCNAAGTPAGTGRAWLEQDIATLAEVFAGLMSVAHLRLRLDIVATNACRKFHIDAVTARLVCTYRGRGTQYGISHGQDDPAEVFEAGQGAPLLLRGTRWPTTPPAGLVHKSPAIEGTGETRLVLVLDPILDQLDAV